MQQGVELRYPSMGSVMLSLLVMKASMANNGDEPLLGDGDDDVLVVWLTLTRE